MSYNEDIDKHVLRKYEIGQKLGKGVSCVANSHVVMAVLLFSVFLNLCCISVGIWYCVEGCREKDTSDGRPQEDL